MLPSRLSELAQWLTSVIPATWEMEIEMFAVGGQPGQKVSETYLKK
jgi:hypothetical protein